MNAIEKQMNDALLLMQNNVLLEKAVMLTAIS